jgi:DNA repair exonuclease SbcCD ATPase subunit
VLIPKKLKFKAAGRFVDEQVIDFTTLGSFVQVEGKNINTGGSSGSGKTTFLRMVEYNLGLNDLSVSILQSRFTKDAISTVGEYDWDGIPVTVERGKSKFSVTVGDQVTTGSVKITEEKLDEIIGMPRELFRKILHKRQGEGGFFLDMGPTDVHKFLTSCLKLEEEQKKILRLDGIAKTLYDKEIDLKLEVASSTASFEASKSALTSLGATPQPPFNIDYVENLKIESLQAFDKYEEASKQYEFEKHELEKTRPKISTTPFDRSGIENAEAQIKEISKKISDLESAELKRQSEAKNKAVSLQLEISNLQKIEWTRQSDVRSKMSTNRLEHSRASNLVNQADQAKESAKRLVLELNKIKAAICPTCEQGWVTDTIKAKEAEITLKLLEHRNTHVAGVAAAKQIVDLDEEHKNLILESSPRALPEVDELNAKIDQIKIEASPRAIPEVLEYKAKIASCNSELQFFRQQEKDHQTKENIKNQDVMTEFANKQIEINKKHESNIKTLNELKNSTVSVYEMANIKYKSFEAEIKRYADSISKLNSQIANYELQVAEKTSKLIATQEEIEIVEESRKAIKSHLSCSFDDAIDSIGDKATRLIRLIPNMANATIQFEGTKETKEGKVKEEVVCMVSMDGEIGVPLKSLSGGERSSCDMCVDLSVIKFIEETTGKGIGMYIIDEGFNGLDTACIQDALEMLREYSVDKKLFLVEHNPIVSESIENKILVVRDGLTSKIVQQ